jgi:transposase
VPVDIAYLPSIVMEDASVLTSLPDDPQALKLLLVERERRIAALAGERDRAARDRDAWQIKFLRAETELLRLRKWYYGRKADTLTGTGDVAQLLLGFGEQLEARGVAPQDLPCDVDPDKVELKTVRRLRRGRRNLAAFDQLPVIRKEHDLPEEHKACPCCGEGRDRIGSETSWQVEYVPGHFERIEHVRYKYACRHCEADALGPRIERADKPSQPIEKGLPGPGLLAYVVTSKFSDYLPLYRLESIFERNGLEIDRATLSVWCRDVAEITTPLYDRMVRRLLQSHVVCTDDTVMPMLAPGKAKQARMWAYVGDDRNPYNVFAFTLSRSRDGPALFLRDYKQTLLADGYGGYDGVVVGNDITRAGCWAHARRKFVDAEKAHPAIAAEAVGLVGRLYAVEGRGEAMDEAARLALRRRESVPVLSALKDKLLGWRDQLLPKHPMAQAIGYALNQWAELNVFAADGAVPIDNNVSEREMKRVVLNRKNSLFVGNERGGRTAAVLSSFTSTCRRHDVDPQRYLTQLLTNLPDTPLSQLDAWLPDRWKLNQPAAAR